VARLPAGRHVSFSFFFLNPPEIIVIINYDQQDATIFDLFISNLLYMLRATPSPIIRSTKLYLQLQVLSTDVAAGWYRG
jgi:hypothetical protein